MTLRLYRLLLLLTAAGIVSGCRTADPSAKFIAEIDRAPADKQPKDWQRTKTLLARKAPEVGAPATDFSLPSLKGGEIIKCGAYHSGRPLVLIFGNYTCPPFRRHSSEAQALYERYRDRAAFLFVYVQEAHPADGWQMETNVTEGVVFNQPREAGERQSIAKKCCANLNLSIPCVVDSIDNSVDNIYAGWPDRIFIIDTQGTIVYAGSQGPWGFKPKEAERTLRRLLKRTPAV